MRPERCAQPWIANEQSSLLTRIAARESVSSLARMEKLPAFVELESTIRADSEEVEKSRS
jgi:hypothetical protein